ncbi:MAG: hypothetical protein OEY06_12850 [Gammaproteobacteria bacterium]|nr:hypothetical protein [Gammaproteobacteria bacterium]
MHIHKSFITLACTGWLFILPGNSEANESPPLNLNTEILALNDEPSGTDEISMDSAPEQKRLSVERNFKFLINTGLGYSGADQLAATAYGSTLAASLSTRASIGLLFPHDDNAFATMATIGYQSDNFVGDMLDFVDSTLSLMNFLSGNDSEDSGTPSSPYDYGFTQSTVSLVEFVNFQHYRIGAGITYHINPTLVCKPNVTNACSGLPVVEYDDAPGVLLQIDFLNQSGDFTIGLRATSTTYKGNGQSIDVAGAEIVAGFLY